MPPRRKRRKNTLLYALESCDPIRLAEYITGKGGADVEVLTKVMMFVKQSKEIFSENKTPLQAAISLGYRNICKQLLEEGASLKSNAMSNTPPPLSLALQMGRFDIARLIINAGADLTINFDDALPMFYALEHPSCNVEIVKNIVSAGFNPNEIIDTLNGFTALHLAVYNGYTSIVKYLLTLPVDVNRCDKNGSAPLHYAIEKKKIKLVKLLLKNGANINAENLINGLTPFLYAIHSEDCELVNLLISLGADIHFCSEKNENTMLPLHYAVLKCSFKMCKFLIEKGADVNKVFPKTGDAALHMACKAKHNSSPSNRIALDCIIELLIKEGAHLEAKNCSGFTPLQVAVNNTSPNLSQIKILIMSGADINTSPKKGDEITFHNICRVTDKEIIKICLDYGGDYMVQDSLDRYPSTVVLLRFIFQCHLPFGPIQSQDDLLTIMKLFWKHGFQFDKIFNHSQEINLMRNLPKVGLIFKKQKVLLKGVKKCDLGVVQRAIALGAEVQCCSQGIPRPVHYLALKGNASIMKEFVSRGVILNYLNESEETPLHIAARHGHLDCCKVLLENGAVYNYRGKTHNKTPVAEAKLNGHRKCIKYLTKVDSFFKALKKGSLIKLNARMEISRAVMNCRHRDGMTLMERAVHLQMKETAEFLMKLRLQMTSCELSVLN